MTDSSINTDELSSEKVSVLTSTDVEYFLDTGEILDPIYNSFEEALARLNNEDAYVIFKIVK